jgi:hypothetical protein
MSLQMPERISDTTGIELHHKVDNRPARAKTVIKPDILGRIDLEGWGVFPSPDGRAVPQLTPTLARLRGGVTLADQIFRDRNGFGLGNVHWRFG